MNNGFIFGMLMASNAFVTIKFLRVITLDRKAFKKGFKTGYEQGLVQSEMAYQSIQDSGDVISANLYVRVQANYPPEC